VTQASQSRRGINRLEPILKGKSHTAKNSKVSFYQARKQVDKKDSGWCDDIFNKMVEICFIQMTAKRGYEHMGKVLWQQCYMNTNI